MEHKIETITPNRVYVVYYTDDFDFDSVLSEYTKIKAGLPEGSELFVLPKDMKMVELSVEELISLRNYIDDCISKMSSNIE